jgi:hypothetical protein
MSDFPQKVADLLAKYGPTVPVYRRHSWLFFRWRSREGWLWVEDHDQYWTIWVSSFRTIGLPGGSPPVAADISKETGERWQRHGLTGAWRTAISAWPVNDENVARQIFELVVERVNHVHESPR